MQKIVITRFWTGDAYKKLQGRYQVDYDPGQLAGLDRAALLEKIRNADAVITMGDEIDREMMDAAPSLKVIADMWWGSRVDRQAAQEKGITVITHQEGTAWLHRAEVEHLFMQLLAARRRLKEADAFVRDGQFVRMEQANREMLGYGLKGHTLGIIGGTAWTGPMIVRRAQAFEMDTVYWDHGDRSEEMERLGARPVSLDELVETADGIMLVVQRSYQGGYVLDRPQLERMKPGAVICNVTHGSMINEEALVEAIRQGRVYGAALDKLEKGTIPAEGLTGLSRVILTPHSDGALYRERARLFEELVDGCVQALENGGKGGEQA